VLNWIISAECARCPVTQRLWLLRLAVRSRDEAGQPTDEITVLAPPPLRDVPIALSWVGGIGWSGSA